MRGPTYQKFITAGTWLAGGFLLLGSMLDAIVNALTIITPFAAYAGTALLVVGSVVVHLLLRHHSLVWHVKGNQTVGLKGLGPRAFSVIAGFVALLWVPMLVEHFSSVGNAPIQATDSHALAPRSASDLITDALITNSTTDTPQSAPALPKLNGNATTPEPITIKRGSLRVAVEVELNQVSPDVSRPSANLVLENSSDELVEYKVIFLDLEIGGVTWDGKTMSLGGFIHPRTSGKYLIDPVGEVRVTEVIRGNLKYRIAYWPSDNPEGVRHTEKDLALELYYPSMRGIFKTRSERED